MYEYECSTCKTEFEELVSLNAADDEVECPQCGQRNSKRKISTVAAGNSTAPNRDCRPGSGFT
ncbi:MAG: zinc ribbon domain-containing protein [Proteobacteria bacterium]|nr:zinc ribbon domain-containing protein [Pseudomonadota bacterium]